MKKNLLLFFALSTAISMNAQLFTQNFSSSTTVADYASATPGAGQFDAIIPETANASTITIENGALRFTRTANASFYAYRNFNFSTNPNFVQLKLDFEGSGNVVGTQTPVFSIYIGSGFSSASTSTSSNYASRFGILAQTTAGEFKIGTVDNIGGAPQSSVFTGKQTFTFVVNNSGSDQTYTGPDANTESVATGKMDVWVGTTKSIDDFSLKNSDAVKGLISSFKIQATSQSGTGVYDFDNIEFTDLGGTGVLATSATPNVEAVNNITVVPTVVENNAEIRNLPATIQSVRLDLYNMNSQLIESKVYTVNNGTVNYNMSNKAQGVYFIKGIAEKPFIGKIVKK